MYNLDSITLLQYNWNKLLEKIKICNWSKVKAKYSDDADEEIPNYQIDTSRPQGSTTTTSTVTNNNTTTIGGNSSGVNSVTEGTVTITYQKNENNQIKDEPFFTTPIIMIIECREIDWISRQSR